MRIAVYPGSFDPLHIGHLAILRYLAQCGCFDATYLIVSPQNPLKDKSKANNAQQRFESAQMAVLRHPQVGARVDDIEMHMPSPHYTINTLDALSERESDNSFTLVMGSDNLASIRMWRDYQRILLKYGVVVYPRDGWEPQELRQDLLQENPSYKLSIIDAPKVNISSTQIRLAISRGEDVSNLLM